MIKVQLKADIALLRETMIDIAIIFRYMFLEKGSGLLIYCCMVLAGINTLLLELIFCLLYYWLFTNSSSFVFVL